MKTRDDCTTLAVRPKPKSVRVNTDELQTLVDVLDRAIDTHKRTVENLQHFARQATDEKKVFTEAKSVIEQLILKTKLTGT